MSPMFKPMGPLNMLSLHVEGLRGPASLCPRKNSGRTGDGQIASPALAAKPETVKSLVLLRSNRYSQTLPVVSSSLLSFFHSGLFGHTLGFAPRWGRVGVLFGRQCFNVAP